ncbi:hypothetical protein QR680_011501 [Steinernema hermaphroditum]|uniref:Peptidase S1 domain-containing protein n=1 Tax=Steinernema hermaphroditum TaxID=289476 RepID=A0AA39I102_9BILA|nr:hypothetical protein QR680_011501 [Steinernema hermaphroditum]
MRLLLSCLALAGLSFAAPPVLPAPNHATSELIFGGHRANQGNFPYYVYLHSCGGSLITPKHILTAAHCILDSTLGNTAVMGLTDNEEYEKQEGVQIRTIVKISGHKEWNDTAKHNDIAILEVDKPFEITRYVQLIDIKSDDTELQKLYWTVAAGFGMSGVKKNDDGRPTGIWPRYLLYTYIPLVDEKYCAKVWWQYYWDKFICAGAEKQGVGSGDSGGPLAVNSDGKYFQIGVVAFSAIGFYDQAKIPAVYTRTASYCDWMTENTDGAFKCI